MTKVIFVMVDCERGMFYCPPRKRLDRLLGDCCAFTCCGRLFLLAGSGCAAGSTTPPTPSGAVTACASVDDGSVCIWSALAAGGSAARGRRASRGFFTELCTCALLLGDTRRFLKLVPVASAVCRRMGLAAPQPAFPLLLVRSASTSLVMPVTTLRYTVWAAASHALAEGEARSPLSSPSKMSTATRSVKCA